MLKKIVWRKRAADKFETIINYLILNWSEKVALKFIDETEQVIKLLKMFPNAGSDSRKRKGLKKFLISEQNMIVYFIKKDKLIIVNIYDTRMDPLKIKY